MLNALEDTLLGVYPEPETIPSPEDEQYSETQERFRITTDDQADWALRKIAQVRRKEAEAAELARVQIERINTWLAGEREKAQRTENFFSGLLVAYYGPKHEKDPKTKTYKLPAGAVQFRAQQPEFARDDATLLGWLKERKMTDLIEVKESPKWGDLKKQCVVATGGQVVFKDTGEVVRGVVATERPEKVTVEV